MSKVGVLGSGMVAQVLAAGFKKYRYEVMVGSRTPAKLAPWQGGAGAGCEVGTFDQAAAFGDIVVLAVNGNVAGDVLDLAGAGNLAGKTIIDACNPIAAAPPVNGVLQFFTGPNDSLMERLQRQMAEAHFVKAFSCVGNAFMVDPQFPGGKPTMFICGNNADAKATVTQILDTFGWDTADMGKVESARAIEPLCQLWCIPGLSGGSWTHAFKLLRM